jgi:hypothetical protein
MMLKPREAPTAPLATTEHATNMPRMTRMSLVTASRRMTAMPPPETSMRRAMGTMMAMPAPPKHRPSSSARVQSRPATAFATAAQATVVTSRTMRESPTDGKP